MLGMKAATTTCWILRWTWFTRTVGLLWLYHASSLHNGVTAKRNGLRDYCQFESFDAQCQPDEVILMKSARYGRMRVGRCVSRDYGYITCAADVLEELDRRCSGRRRCHFNIPTLRDNYQPCPKDLTAYLEASYSCVKASLLNFTCHNRKSVMVNSTSGYISSLPVSETGYGSVRCPLVIQGQPGQTINFTLYGASADRLDATANTINRRCPYHAIVKDKKSANVSLCATKHRRSESIYVSQGHTVTFYIDRNPHTDTSVQALLKFEVEGCPDPRPPRSAWVQRQGQRAVVRCNHTSETWYLTCRGRSWIGSVSNCTKVASWSTEKMTTTAETFPLGLLIAISIGVIVGIMMGLVMLIFVFVFRRRSRRRRLRNKAKTLLEEDTSQENEENYARRLMQVERSSVSSLSKHGAVTAAGGGGGGGSGGGGGLCGEYTQMWELRRSQPLSTHTVISTDSGLDVAPGNCGMGGAATVAAGGGTAGGGVGPACCSGVKTTFSTFKPSGECPYERPHLVAMEAMLAAQSVDHVPYYFEYDPPLDDETGGMSANVVECSRDVASTTKRPDLLSNSNRKNNVANAVNEATANSSSNGAKAEGATLHIVPCQKVTSPRDVCDHCARHPCIDKALDETVPNMQAQSL